VATYKLIQDIEAEDHILGPLTLRQFIYGLIATLFFYLTFIVITKGVAWIAIILLPPGLLLAFFAFPFGKDQPTEVWALAKLRFMLKPRRRIWDQSGIKELVTITAPKKIERILTNGLSQSEVESRLHALANTLDSRGWAVKNINVSAYSNPDPFMAQSSDRLIDVSSLPREVPNYEIHASDDILDAASNPVAQQFEHMIEKSEQNHRQQIISQLNSPTPVASFAGPQGGAPSPSNYWFMNQPSGMQPQRIDDGTTPPRKPQQDAPEEQELAKKIKAHNKQQNVSNSHLRTLKPADHKSHAYKPKTDQKPEQPTSTPPADPAILSLASNNDLNVATLARQAKRDRGDEPQDEVVISLR
jgi:hypothetical protein